MSVYVCCKQFITLRQWFSTYFIQSASLTISLKLASFSTEQAILAQNSERMNYEKLYFTFNR